MHGVSARRQGQGGLSLGVCGVGGKRAQDRLLPGRVVVVFLVSVDRLCALVIPLGMDGYGIHDGSQHPFFFLFF